MIFSFFFCLYVYVCGDEAFSKVYLFYYHENVLAIAVFIHFFIWLFIRVYIFAD